MLDFGGFPDFSDRILERRDGTNVGMPLITPLFHFLMGPRCVTEAAGDGSNERTPSILVRSHVLFILVHISKYLSTVLILTHSAARPP